MAKLSLPIPKFLMRVIIRRMIKKHGINYVLDNFSRTMGEDESKYAKEDNCKTTTEEVESILKDYPELTAGRETLTKLVNSRRIRNGLPT